jgi:hypothetical protein
MEQPPGYSDYKFKVCKLHKTIYGLKKLGQQWHKTLMSQLKTKSFKQSELDWGVYLRRNNKGTVMLSIYEDDIILYASSPELMKHSKQQLLSKSDSIWV